MRSRSVMIPLLFSVALPLAASTGPTKRDKATLREAAGVLEALTRSPDTGIPRELLAQADCILIFPTVAKGAFIAGGKSGHGVASCRQPDGRMGSAAFYTAGRADIGSRAGGQLAGVVMLIMNENGVSHLLADRFTIGREAAAPAGPVGHAARSATETQLGAQILSWSRSRDHDAGAALDGSVVQTNHEANARLYGDFTSGRKILVNSPLAVPDPARPFVEAIRRHMAVAAASGQAGAR
jgi:SH3 domain-containing YSC84-like protein 1